MVHNDQINIEYVSEIGDFYSNNETIIDSLQLLTAYATSLLNVSMNNLY
jgi:hypothetical protein